MKTPSSSGLPKYSLHEEIDVINLVWYGSNHEKRNTKPIARRSARLGHVRRCMWCACSGGGTAFDDIKANGAGSDREHPYDSVQGLAELIDTGRMPNNPAVVIGNNSVVATDSLTMNELRPYR